MALLLRLTCGQSLDFVLLAVGAAGFVSTLTLLLGRGGYLRVALGECPAKEVGGERVFKGDGDVARV